MSIKRPKYPECSSYSSFRKAIQLALVSPFFFAQASDLVPSEVPAKDETNYDHLFDGIEIVPDGTLEDKPEPDNEVIPDDPFCTPDTCKPA